MFVNVVLFKIRAFMRSSRLQVQVLEPEAQVSDRYKTTNYSLNEFLESTIEDWQA